MAESFLRDYQIEALRKMKNGCVLCGGVGSGKSRTSLAYYFLTQGGRIETKIVKPMSNPKDLYIITKAKKRDELEWEGEMIPFLLSSKPEDNHYNNKVVIDSWNNIEKYVSVKDSFFIFDEQGASGKGKWAKTFVKIAKGNNWILLSATPGDKWEDYVPLFLANGFYKNRTEFNRLHAVYSRFTTFPKIDRYVNTKHLYKLKNSIVVYMDFDRETVSHHEYINCDYDILAYKRVFKDRWNIWDDEPIENPSQLCYSLRRVVNSDESRQLQLLSIFEKHPKLIIFYNYDYELEILKNLTYGDDVEIAEWNGHNHQAIPEGDKWVYLVQYTAGCEGWNCITTDTILFYSQNYSYKVMEQARGRIDRMNTPFTDLYYYHLKSRASIDIAISRAVESKKLFNERRFTNDF